MGVKESCPPRTLGQEQALEAGVRSKEQIPAFQMPPAPTLPSLNSLTGNQSTELIGLLLAPRLPPICTHPSQKQSRPPRQTHSGPRETKE